MVSRRSFGSLYQRCQSDSALNECDGKNMHSQNEPDKEIRNISLELAEVKTRFEYTTGILNQTENELVSTRMELYGTMKELAEIKDECSFYEDKVRQFDQMKIQVMRLQNELRDSKRQIKNLQAELQVRSENDNHGIIESGRRQLHVEQPIENLQVNPQYDGTYGQNNNEFLPQNTHSIQSVDYNHRQSYTSRVNGISNTNMVPQRSFRHTTLGLQVSLITVTHMSRSLDSHIIMVRPIL